MLFRSRYDSGALHPDFALKLAKLMELTDRDGYEEPIEGKDAGKPTEQASLRAELGASI